MILNLGSFGDCDPSIQSCSDVCDPSIQSCPGESSSGLAAAVSQALEQYELAWSNANMACIAGSGNPIQSVFDWFTGNTTTESVCNAAEQMKVNYDEYVQLNSDPSTSDSTRQEILAAIAKEVDISAITATARAGDAVTIISKSIKDAPATAANMAVDAAGVVLDTAGQAAKKVAKELVPWWAWPIGGLALAMALGWKPMK